MKTSVERQPKGRATIRIELAPEEFKPYLNAAAAAISAEEKFSGFRPGRAPVDVVEQRLGRDHFWHEALERATPKLVTAAVMAEKLVTVGKAEVKVERLIPGEPVAFSASVTLLPDVELPDLAKVKVEKKTPKVPEGELEKTLENLRRMFAKEKRVMRPAKPGDKLEIDFRLSRDGVEVDGGQSENHPIVIGEGHHIPGFEDQLVGMTEGQTREFTLRFPDGYHSSHLAGKDGQFKVTTKAVYEIELPAIDDAFAKNVGQFDDLPDLKTKLGENLFEEAKQKEEDRYELALIDAVIAKSKFGEIPDSLIEAELNKMFVELRVEVERRGMVFKDYLEATKRTEDQLRQEFRPQAERRVKSALVIRKIAEQNQIDASEAELDAAVEVERSRHREQPETLKEIDTDDFRQYLKNTLVSKKAAEKLKELAS